MTATRIKMYSPATVKQKMTPPPDDISYFHTAGRMLSYFPQINDNGVAFFREDCTPVLSSLRAATADVEHVKPCNDVPAMNGQKNTTMGAILDFHEDEEGIDIVCKNQIDLAKAMGFTPEDFRKSGEYAKYSQECDHMPADSSWIIVDKNDPSKVVREVSFLDGLAQNYRRSHVVNGKWDYFTVDGNPVYIRVRPTAFVGVGHVSVPADESARVYSRLLSSVDKSLSNFYPGMDDGPDVPRDMISDGPGALGDERSPFGGDYMLHPDLMMPSSLEDQAGDGPPADDPARPDSHYAAVWAEPHPDKGLGELVTKRALPIRDKKGNLDRNALVSAFHAVTGSRGNTLVTAKMPSTVKLHALQLIREGLNLTKPSRENSNTMDDLNKFAPELAKYNELLAEKNQKDNEIASLTSKIADLEKTVGELTSAKESEVASRETTISALTAEINAFKGKELSQKRLAELEAIHPFKPEEKTDEYVTSLSSLDDARYDNEKLRRELAKRDADAAAAKARENSSRATAPGGTPYIPQYNGGESKFKDLKIEDILV